MGMNNRQTILFLFGTAFAAVSLWPDMARGGGEQVRVGIYQNPPKVFLTHGGEPQGFWPDLVAAIATAENWQVDYVPCYWNRCLQLVEQGDLDLMVDVAFTPVREQRFEFNQEAVFSSWSVVYGRRGVTFSSILDLDQKRVAVLKDSIQQEVLSQRAYEFSIAPELVEVKDFAQMYEALAAGTVEAAVVNQFLGRQWEQQLAVQPTPILVEPSRLHFIAAKGTRSPLLAEVDQNLRRLKADPDSAYYQAMDRWLSPRSPSLLEKLRPFLPPLAALGLGVGCLISLLWNRSLRDEIKRRRHVEEQLQCLADNTPGVIFRLQRQGDGAVGLLYVSSRALDFWGVTAEILMETPEVLCQLVPPEDLQRLRQSLYDSAKTLAPWAEEWQATTPSGQPVWMQVIASPQAQPDGSVIWDGLVLDITERKQQEAQRQAMEASLRQSEAMVRQMLQAIPDLLLWTRPDGTCVGISEGQELQNLMTDKATLGTNQYELLPPDLVAQRKEAFHQALTTGRVQVYEQELPIENILQYEEVRVVPVEPDLLLVIVRDISDRKRREIERIRNEAYRRQAAQALRDSERRYRQVVEAQSDFILHSQPDTTITFANEALCRAMGITSEEIIGKRWRDLASPEDLEADAFKGLALLTPEKPRFFAENRDNRADGEVGWTQWLNQGIFDDQGNLIEIQSVGRDITALKQAEQAARESEHRYRLVAENISDLVCLNDLEGCYVYVSPSCKTQLGYQPEDLLGRTFYEFIHPDEQDLLRTEIHRQAVKGETISPLTHRVRNAQGDYIWVETLVNPILNKAGKITQFQTTSRDVTDRVQVEQQLRHAALNDALTGLPNRSVLMERLGVVIEQTSQVPDQQSALLFLDLDQFKVVNDSLGHLTGDQLLVWVAHKLTQVVRTTDIVARISGDEFVILLENLEQQDQAIQVAERILEELREPFMLEQREIFITSSIGIVMDFRNYQKAEDLVRDADIAMYQAKASGRASYAVFDPEMRLQVIERMNLGNDLRRALEYQELQLYYQPIVALETLDIVGLEVLLRWQHPQLGLVSPEQFIPLAEETGLILPIGNWITQTACQQLVTWRRHSPAARNLRVSINLSVRQLQSSDLFAQFETVLGDTGLPPDALTMEITESMLVKNFEATHRLLSKMQARGVHISIDDFGTGYSSLSYLHRLPVDALKIDRTFVSHMGQDARNQTIAESIIALSNVLELDAIAEGIETVEQLHWLQDHGCEYGQGYLFSPPVPAAAVYDLLKQDLFTSIAPHNRGLPIAKAGHVPPVSHVSDDGPN